MSTRVLGCVYRGRNGYGIIMLTILSSTPLGKVENVKVSFKKNGGQKCRCYFIAFVCHCLIFSCLFADNSTQNLVILLSQYSVTVLNYIQTVVVF